MKINEDEAAVVRLIFDKYVSEGFGFQAIANYLTERGVKPRKLEKWSHNTIRNIIQNRIYIGYLKSGETVSPHLPELQIVSDKIFEEANLIRQQRSKAKVEQSRPPINMKGMSLLSGNVFCGHCGSRLHLTSHTKKYHRADGAVTSNVTIRYTCYKKSRKLSVCEGQTTYSMVKLDGVIDQIIKDVFTKMQGVPKAALFRFAMKKNFLKSGKTLLMRKRNTIKNLKS